MRAVGKLNIQPPPNFQRITNPVLDIKNGKGSAADLFVNEVEKPGISSSQCLVKVKAFGLNRMDILQRQGMYPIPPGVSKILGVEFSGVIEAVDADVRESFKVGDEVFGLAYGGAYAEYVAVSSRMLMHKPSHLSWEQAAGIPETWITATQALYLVGGYQTGQSVLWHAGASSVSIAGAQLARADGAKAVYVTSRTHEKIDWCKKELGATQGFDTSDGKQWAKELQEATGGKGVDVIVDFMGASTFAQNLEAAAVEGHIVNLGIMGGTKLPEGVDISAFLRKRVRYEGSTLRARDTEYQGKLRDRLEQYLPKFESGEFKVPIEKVFKWEDVAEAHKLMESNKTKGKIICTIG